MEQTMTDAQKRLQEKALERLKKQGGTSALGVESTEDDSLPQTDMPDFRAPSEDDDGYDPYSDYMDQLAASTYEGLEEDPWR